MRFYRLGFRDKGFLDLRCREEGLGIGDSGFMVRSKFLGSMDFRFPAQQGGSLTGAVFWIHQP